MRLLSLLTILTSACVTSGTHEALQKEFADARAAHKKAMDERNAVIEERDHAIAQLHVEASDLLKNWDGTKASLASAQQNLEDTKTELAGTQGDLSEVLKSRSELKASIKEMQTALGQMQARKKAADARMERFKQLLSKFKSLIDAGKLKVRIVDGRMVVQLATDVLFQSGSADLSDDGKAAITEVTEVLASVPERTYQVEGHTDNVPIKTAQYPSNWHLASARSLAVVQTMIDAGIPPQRISAAAFGEFKPVVSNKAREKRKQNRRIEIVVVPDLSGLPGFDQLQKATK